MNAFGRQVGDESECPLALGEVTIVADAARLREVSRFLLHVADEMDVHGTAFGHAHFEDFIGERFPEVMLIVAREREAAP